MNAKAVLDLIEAMLGQTGLASITLVRVPGGLALMQTNGGHLFISVRPADLAVSE